MAAPDFPDVTLAHADPALLLCWEEKVRQGVECTLLLKHSRGKVITIIKCRKSLKSDQAEKKKKTRKELTVIPATPLEAKPSRLMFEQAAPTSQPSKQTQGSAPEESHTEHKIAVLISTEYCNTSCK